MLALDTLALGPSFQTMGSASKAFFACQKLSATTATVSSSTRSTCRTPGIAATALASKLTNLPP